MLIIVTPIKSTDYDMILAAILFRVNGFACVQHNHIIIKK